MLQREAASGATRRLAPWCGCALMMLRHLRALKVRSCGTCWQPDWGGLLLFLNEKHDVTEGYLPRFNVMTIFDIRWLHTVTQVSTFAGGGRYSVTGWFQDDPTRRAGTTNAG